MIIAVLIMKPCHQDFVIGTHALLADGVKFRELGLLIIDEEQHFGVKHKERLKEMRAHVHVLTLTATPIPRTLQLALSGVRELSLITTPPLDRLLAHTNKDAHESIAAALWRDSPSRLRRRNDRLPARRTRAQTAKRQDRRGHRRVVSTRGAQTNLMTSAPRCPDPLAEPSAPPLEREARQGGDQDNREEDGMTWACGAPSGDVSP